MSANAVSANVVNANVVNANVVDAILEAARAEAPAWPAGLDEDGLRAFVAVAAEGQDGRALAATDLVLAFAAARGNVAAVAAVDALLEDVQRGASSRARLDADRAREALSNVREKLLVGGGTPRLLEYRGRGPLRSWLYVIVLRALLDEARSLSREPPTDDGVFEALTSEAPDPHLAYAKALYLPACREAFGRAITSLPPRSRVLLKMAHVDHTPIEAIAALYQVHRATVHRWLVEARSQLGHAFRSELAGRLTIGFDEVESVVALVESRLEVSLVRLLGSDGDAP